MEHTVSYPSIPFTMATALVTPGDRHLIAAPEPPKGTRTVKKLAPGSRRAN
ncbi:hypothetical protein [Pelagicoccus sp. SDUM812003]|uniref:hypothetical protein n=1 Tax=Pelagicoccus sp. SDUM812003 TaxID=3041267 RepID=UPI00280F8B30|nr:hypothetical protein [Pelagicoccus sp. SDUM812003]MDQ8201384.1 hypothetical protein [Pelagicoccus sp. SDUM812003]